MSVNVIRLTQRIKTQLKQELKEELLAELRAELQPKIKKAKGDTDGRQKESTIRKTKAAENKSE